MLADPDGALRVIASSSEAMRTLELFEIQSQEGPCFDSYATGAAVARGNLESAGSRWPHFAPKAIGAGFRGVQALPLRHRVKTIGALNLFDTDQQSVPEVDLVSAQAFADIATIAIMQDRTATEMQALNDQLRGALSTRVVVEQAKGVLAASRNIDMDQAFGLLRSYARSSNLRLAQVCGDLISGKLDPAVLQLVSRSARRRR